LESAALQPRQVRHHLYPFTTASAQGPPAPSADLRKHAVNSLGRTTKRSINNAAQNAAYDALGRVTALTNALGGFTNNYVNATFRLSSVAYPNGQSTLFSYSSTPA